ncbi:MAG: nickel-responsive transcriptional regulator NikR [Puniceicoccaceae bacterium]
MIPTSTGNPLQRISMTIPESSLRLLDEMVNARGYANRSQGLNEILNREIAEYQSHQGDQLMAGSITLFYQNTRANVQAKLAAIQRNHIDEVISSLHVLLEEDHTMEVLLVQGQAPKLREIANELISTKGVKNGTLTLSTTVIPPIHGKK